MQTMNVESFNLDHTKVCAPFIRLADVKRLPHGDVLSKYDIRFCQPGREHLDMKAVHSIEHSFAEFSRNHCETVVDFSPMGCQTGFYLILASEPDIRAAIELTEKTFHDILNAKEVPAANDIQCGWGANHSLEAAQSAVAAMLSRREKWEKVYDE